VVFSPALSVKGIYRVTSGRYRMAKVSRQKLFFFARLAITIAALVLLLRLVGWEQLAQLARVADPKWLLLSYVAALGAMLMNSALLWQLLGHVGLDVKLTRVVLANSLSILYTLVLPGDVLAGAAKWVDLSAATGDKVRVFSALVSAKISLALAPLAIGSVALAFENPFDTRAVPMVAIAASVVLVIVAALYVNARTGALIDQAVGALLRILPGAIALRAQAVSNAFAEYRTLGATNGVFVLFYSVAAFALGVIAMAFAAMAVGADVPVEVFAWVNMILFIARLFPLTISNLGIREGIMIAVLGLYGVGAAAAFAIGIVMFSFTLMIALVGSVYQISVAAGWIEWRGS